MKLAEHVDHLRELIEAAFDKQFARLGFSKAKQMDAEQVQRLPEEVQSKRQRFVAMLENHIGETGSYASAREKLLDELTFTLFNRLAAIKVMEAASLFPPILTKQKEHGDRAFGHKAWLEAHPEMREAELEGIRHYLKAAFDELGSSLPLYSKNYPYAMLPDAISLNDIIDAFNAVEQDEYIIKTYEAGIWHSDDVLGWMYESYNNKKKQAHKDSKAKVEYDKVSLQSQFYTPRWVVQFLVENSLGKMYLEMYPNSEIKQRYKIANAPATQTRKRKPLHEIKTIDPACGSGNFLLYAFDFYYALYQDQIDNYGADYEEKDIPKLIIENNLHGIDLDDRAIQLAQLGLFIKAKKKRRTIGELHFKVVSSDFYLPEYHEVQHIFEHGNYVSIDQRSIIEKIWADLRYAYKFGSLIHLDQELKEQLAKVKELALGDTFDATSKIKKKIVEGDLFAAADYVEHKEFTESFFSNLFTAVEQYSRTSSNTFLANKTRDSITFLGVITTEFEIVTSNPPYTDSSDFGEELSFFIESNYKKDSKFHTNLYSAFIKRSFDLACPDGSIALIHPDTFMFIKTYESVRGYILNNSHINIFVHYPQTGGVFGIGLVYPAFYVLEKSRTSESSSIFMKMDTGDDGRKNEAEIFSRNLSALLIGDYSSNCYQVNQCEMFSIESTPLIYWISSSFRKLFKGNTVSSFYDVNFGLKTANNFRYLKYSWEVSSSPKRHYTSIYKAGPSNKWYGNLWLTIDYEHQKKYIEMEKSSGFSGEKNYKKLGIICPSISAQATTFRINEDSIFSNADLGIYPKDGNLDIDLYYSLGFFNSKLVQHINKMLNPTVNTMPNDIKRIPFINFDNNHSKTVSEISLVAFRIKKHLCQFEMINKEFNISPVLHWGGGLDDIRNYFNYENLLLAYVTLGEAVIDDNIFNLYGVTDTDRLAIIKMDGESIGGLPILQEARSAFKFALNSVPDFFNSKIVNFIDDLDDLEINLQNQVEIESALPNLYQNNNDLVSFSIKHKINPVNVWYWFKNSKALPKFRAKKVIFEFITGIVRDELIEDSDGIIPLVSNTGEITMFERVEKNLLNKNFSATEFSNLDFILGRDMNSYLIDCFFEDLSEHLNLFQYLPKTPFIWHLTSGPNKGFDCFILIHKWNRDNLLRLRSVYIENRERGLLNRQTDLQGKPQLSAKEQSELDTIFKQLKEIESFKAKIDELLAEGYNPILDSGVGKNIAPLQKKKMLAYDVLNPGQLKTYLNADW